jgi:uncharacterized paraquat-inducible protein A
MFSDVFVIAMLMLIVARKRMTAPLVATGAVSLATYGWFVVNL